MRAAVRIAERRSRLLGLDAQVAAKLELSGAPLVVQHEVAANYDHLSDAELTSESNDFEQLAASVEAGGIGTAAAARPGRTLCACRRRANRQRLVNRLNASGRPRAALGFSAAGPGVASARRSCPSAALWLKPPRVMTVRAFGTRKRHDDDEITSF